jgi:hypothetical protein
MHTEELNSALQKLQEIHSTTAHFIVNGKIKEAIERELEYRKLFSWIIQLSKSTSRNR